MSGSLSCPKTCKTQPVKTIKERRRFIFHRFVDCGPLLFII
jgi:hypothetical protein